MDQDPFAAMAEVLVSTQARSVATHFIMIELMRYLAAQHPDPRAFLSLLYERTMRRLGEAEPGEEIAATEARETIERFFANQVKGLPRGSSPHGA